MVQQVRKIVITGGPCGGKTSAIPFLVKELTALGYLPFVVPEAPTILMNAGITPRGGVVPLATFQESVLELFITLEDAAVRAALESGHAKPVIICDRGILDAMAYMPKDMFEAMMLARGITIESLRNERYTAVFHMQSTAIGAPQFYSTTNNPARLESFEEAQVADERTFAAWVGHPRLTVIHNEGRNFEQKLQKLFEHVCTVLCVE